MKQLPPHAPLPGMEPTDANEATVGQFLCCEPDGPCWLPAKFKQVDPANSLVRLVCEDCVREALPYDPLPTPEEVGERERTYEDYAPGWDLARASDAIDGIPNLEGDTVPESMPQITVEEANAEVRAMIDESPLREPIHGDDLPRPDDMPDLPMPGDRW